MRWEEIDRDWFWDAPESDVENKRLHGVPLPKLARDVLGPRQTQGKVFGEIDLGPIGSEDQKAQSALTTSFTTACVIWLKPKWLSCATRKHAH